MSMKAWMRAGLLGGLVLLTACSQSPSEMGPATLGDRAVLERLADSYTSISDGTLSVSPMSLPGDERRRFLEKVFQDAGYDYGLTLAALADGLDKNNKLHRDLAELAMMPHTKAKYPMDPAEIYSSQELQLIAKIERALKGY